VLRVDTIAELFSMAEVLGKQPRPRGPRLTVLTNAGGPGVLATDALIASAGELTRLGEATTRALDAVLPPHWSHGNPIDLLGDASPERYGRALEIAAADEAADGLLVILAPQAATDPTGTAEAVRRFAKVPGKPVLASWMGGGEVEAGDAILSRAGVPTFQHPDMAARIFTHMWRYSDRLRALYETPVLAAGGEAGPTAAADAARALIDSVRAVGRTILTEIESKAVLSHYGIPTVEPRHASTVDEAVAAADVIGYPVVVKLHSETLTHKADAGGVHLDLRGAAEVRAAYAATQAAVTARAGAGHFSGVTVQRMERREGYELILGSSLDPQFGPVLLFGAGGRLAEVHGDHALGLPPLNTTLARRLMEQTRIFAALSGGGGRPPADVEAVEDLLVRFSRLVAEQRGIAEVDVNPVLASRDGVVALDARVVVHGREMTEAGVPPLAISPYPTQYVSTFRLRDGREVRIRPIRPEDEPMMVRFHETLSERSVYFRYFHLIRLGQRVSHERLTRICFIDYDRDMALVAETLPGGGEAAAIVGVGRLTRQRGVPSAEFAILVGDELQGQGLGSELLRRVVQVGRDQRLSRITADILPENRDMQRVAEKVGFACRYDADSGVVRAEMELEARSLQF
jgi:acetyltransferase